MYNPDTDLLFPLRAVPALSEERGELWKGLVTSVEAADEESLEPTAFILMMARMNACSTCNSDSFRALNGCTFCAKQALKRFHGTDEELISMFLSARSEVENFLETNGC